MSIILNVSGRIFKVSREVICRSEMFCNMLADCVVDDEIAIDRSSKLFEHVYAYLLDSKYPYPKKYYSELDYYLVQYDIEQLYDSHKNCGEVQKRMMNIALDRICELISGGDRECAYSGCDSGCLPGYLVCRQHRHYCCHTNNGGCDNDTYGSIPYCDEHIYEHGFENW
uniref:BTB domain-containing protein n=1 Tax=viral metagenome TaxID=1070528 RepID=A0A6C0C6W0_9ZZZZ